MIDPEDSGAPDAESFEGRAPCTKLLIMLNDLRHNFPYVEIMMRNGMEFNGLIVPVQLESFLPSPRTITHLPEGSSGLSPTAQDLRDLMELADAPSAEEPLLPGVPGTPVVEDVSHPGTRTHPTPIPFVYNGECTAGQLMAVLAALSPDTPVLVTPWPN